MNPHFRSRERLKGIGSPLAGVADVESAFMALIVTSQ
jgi:hypothetical protein